MSTTSSSSSSASSVSSRISAFVAGVVISLLIVHASDNITNSSSFIPRSRGIAASTVSDRDLPFANGDLTPRTAFFCSNQSSSSHSHSRRSRPPCSPARSLRYAFVGDSIMYGNGTHSGVGRFIPHAGVWPLDVFRDMRHRADSCSQNNNNVVDDDDGAADADRNNDYYYSRRVFFDARNYAVEGTSVSCDFNAISNERNFRRALSFKPDVVVCAMGTNDAVRFCSCCDRPSADGKVADAAVAATPWRPPANCSTCSNESHGDFRSDVFVSKYSAMIDQFRKVGGAKLVILVTPPPMLRSSWTKSHGFDVQRLSRVVVPLIKKVANLKKTRLVDLHSAMLEEDKLYALHLLRHEANGGGENKTNNNTLLTVARASLLREHLLWRDGVHLRVLGHRLAATVFQRSVCNMD